ncbi:hypothetical protein EMMF5_005170 [Cystobasidiomycetes sp. EMM_F5]
MPLDKPQLVSTVTLPESSVLCIAQVGDYIFAGLGSGIIRCIDASTLRTKCDLVGHAGSILSLCGVELPKRKWLISASADSTVRIWDSRRLQLLWAVLPPPELVGDILSVTYMNDRVVLGCQSCAILVNLPDAGLRPEGFCTPPPGGRYNKFFDRRSLSSSPDPSELSLEGLTQQSITDVVQSCVTIDGRNALTPSHYGYVYALTCANFDKEDVLVSGAGDGVIKLWTCNSTGFAFRNVLAEDDDCAVLSLASRDDATLFAGFQNGMIRVFDLHTGSGIRNLSATTDDIMSLSLLQDSCIATTSNGNLQLWSPAFLLDGTYHSHDGIALSSAVSADGTFIYTGGNDGTMKIWQIGSGNQTIVQSDALEGRMFRLLTEFVAFPSISSSESHREDVRDAMTLLGANATILPGSKGRNPLVLAKFIPRAAEARAHRKRVLFYGHYDVVSDLGEWTSGNAFTLRGIDGYLYGRGVIDNKGPIIAVACAAADLLDAKQLDIDVIMLLEGEEETVRLLPPSAAYDYAEAAGLRTAQDCETLFALIVRRSMLVRFMHLSGQVVTERQRSVLVSNSYSLSEDIPSIMFGLRGRINLTISVTSANPDLHSGMHGGLCDEPLIQLTRLIGSLVDPESGEISVPGFYDSVRPIIQYVLLNTAIVLSLRVICRFEDEAYEEVIRRCSAESLSALTSGSRYPDAKQALIHSVHKVEVSGSKISTVIPARASAKVSVRTVPDMPLKQIAASITTYLQAEFAKARGTTNRLEPLKCRQVHLDSSAPWWIADPQHPFSQAAEQAVFDEWRVQPLWIREGGSLPSLPFLESFFKASTVHLPMGHQGDHAHLVNEKTSITNLQHGKRVVANWFKALAALD